MSFPNFPILFFLLCIQLHLNLSSCSDIASELKDFFSSTYIKKINGDRKIFPCVLTGWSIHRFHHVCIKGGDDGLILGIDAIPNDWTHLKKNESVKGIVTASEWNSLKGNRRTTYAIRVALKDVHQIDFVPGPTLFANCHDQEINSQNPAHWMMKLGTLFEISKCQKTAKEQQNKSIFTTADGEVPHHMKNFYMHQCPLPTSTDWEWGLGMYRIVQDTLEESLILDPSYKLQIANYSYSKAGSNHHKNTGILTCFEDMFMSARVGNGCLLLIYICNFHVINHFLLIYICKLHWNPRRYMDVAGVQFGFISREGRPGFFLISAIYDHYLHIGNL